MMLLPSLVFGSQVEGARMLEVRGQNDSLITSLAGELNAEVPGIKGNENELEVIRRQVFIGKLVESRDGVSKGSRVSHMFPRQCCQTRW